VPFEVRKTSEIGSFMLFSLSFRSFLFFLLILFLAAFFNFDGVRSFLQSMFVSPISCPSFSSSPTVVS
jgi:hypothetical protein